MKSEVIVRWAAADESRIDLEEVQPMPHEQARAWLDGEFTRLGCEPLRLTGKVLAADKVLLVARAAGRAAFADRAWAQTYARAVEAALGKPVVRVDVAAMSVGY